MFPFRRILCTHRSLLSTQLNPNGQCTSSPTIDVGRRLLTCIYSLSILRSHGYRPQKICAAPWVLFMIIQYGKPNLFSDTMLRVKDPQRSSKTLVSLLSISFESDFVSQIL